jgi:hypothetical protein
MTCSAPPPGGLYTWELLFSQLVELVTVVVLRQQPSVGRQCARSIRQASGWEEVVASRPGEKTERAKAIEL